MRKSVTIFITLIVVIVLSFLIGTGFNKQSYITLIDYSVSDDSKELVFDVSVSASMGYIRGFKDNKEEGKHYLDFYSTFGGLNSSLGAKNSFELELDANDTEIYFNYDGGYALILQKNIETGKWERVLR